MPIEDIPRLGLGTFSSGNREQWRENVRTALAAGYRHVDTAAVYENEEYVGQGIAESEVPREEIFLATKTVHPPDVPVADPTYDDVIEGIEASLDRLGVDYVDLLYIHWPAGNYDPEVALPAFDEARERGLTRHIGLSNFEPDLLDEARGILEAPILAHQVEYHPLLDQSHLLEYAREHDHWLVAYSPLGKGAAIEDPTIREIAEKHDVTPAQVALAWLLSQDHVAAIPKAASEDHQRQNLAALEFDLDPADIERIDDIERTHREIDPAHGPWNR